MGNALVDELAVDLKQDLLRMFGPDAEDEAEDHLERYPLHPRPQLDLLAERPARDLGGGAFMTDAIAIKGLRKSFGSLEIIRAGDVGLAA